jgi:hypothetical protein
MCRGSRERKIADTAKGKEGVALVLEQPELGLDKFASCVEGGLEQVSLKAVDRPAKNGGREAPERFGLGIGTTFSPIRPERKSRDGNW